MRALPSQGGSGRTGGHPAPAATSGTPIEGLDRQPTKVYPATGVTDRVRRQGTVRRGDGTPVIRAEGWPAVVHSKPTLRSNLKAPDPRFTADGRSLARSTGLNLNGGPPYSLQYHRWCRARA